MDRRGYRVAVQLPPVSLEVVIGLFWLQQWRLQLHCSKKIGNGLVSIWRGMFEPVVTRFCDDSDNVLDLFLNPVRGTRREIEYKAFEVRRDVFHHDGSRKPSGHGCTSAVHADPSESGRRLCMKTSDHRDSAADFVDDLSIAITLRVYFFFAAWLEKNSFMRRTACHCQVAK
jgi:hypothetical protein